MATQIRTGDDPAQAAKFLAMRVHARRVGAPQQSRVEEVGRHFCNEFLARMASIGKREAA